MKRCICSKCRIQPKKARYYKVTNIRKAIILHGPFYGDILRKNNSLYIIDKMLKPRLLRRDTCKQYIIPEKYKKDLGEKYWSKVPEFKKKHIENKTICELRQDARKKGLSQQGRKQDLIVRLSGSGICYESMTRDQLLERAKKRKILYRHSMKKEELISALRK